MIVLLGFAFLSGVITILSPCILPVLPIVLSGGVGGGKARPFGVLTGFVVSFTVFTLTLSAIVQALGIPVDALRIVAVVLIVLFGVVMLVPWLRDRFELLTSRIASRGSRAGGTAGTGGSVSTAAAGASAGSAARVRWTGYASGVVVGLSLGLIWTPCVGPIMASVISLALTQHVDGGSVFITLAYTLGTSLPMLGVMIGGRALLNKVPSLTRNAANIQKGFGVLMIVMGVVIGLGWDRQFQAAVLRAFPNYGSGLTVIEKAAPVQSALKTRQPGSTSMQGMRSASGVFSAPDTAPENGVLGDYGAAPAFLTNGMWFNTEGLSPSPGQMTQGGSMPLTLEALRGKVVVVDFWTYSCVNCVRTLPYLKAWYDAYRDKGLVIVGVHTPEFEFEKSTANVARAIRDLGVTWPVVQDNDYAQWTAYANQYWPAHYFIDARGRVRYFHFGEGDYDVSEKVIQELLKEAGASVGGIVSKPGPRLESQTPETYLGYDRGSGFVSAVAAAPDKVADYRPARQPGNGEWNLTGAWTITPQYILAASSGTLRLGFNAKNVFLVVEPEAGAGSISVFVDDRPAADTPDVKAGKVSPRESRMYQLVALAAAGPHILRLEVTGKLRLFAFTFG
ncbi:MAG: cytochrome c biogenesis protein DipZ [Spirochaetia bacterium]|jgi:cytochrome c biogenesis protein CcdA/thiol-disulfide isomerase/thioredoxin